MASAAAPPFVSYCSLTEVVVPPAEWGYVYASLQAHKAHVQEYPGCQGMNVYAGVEDDGSMSLQCYSIWDTADQLEAFLERGYTFERLFNDLRVTRVERTQLLERIF